MIEFQGITYKSNVALCKKFNVHINTFNRRRAKGITLDQCLGIGFSSHAVTFEGVYYRTQCDLLKHYGIRGNTFWSRRKRGLTMRQCLGLDPYRPSYAGWREMGLCDEEGVIIEKAHYRLYEIVNLINNKVCIGITTQTLASRWSTHLRDSLTKNLPLYHAMRKYGSNNFEIRLIREDAKSSRDLMQQEVDEIKDRNTTDRRFGYNVASGGSKGNSKAFIISGKTFPSRLEAAAHFGVNIASFNKRIRDGATPEQITGLEPMPNLRNHRIIINDREMNLMDAVVSLHKNYKQIESRLRRGWTYQQAFDIDLPPSRSSHSKRSRSVNYDTLRVLMV